MRINQNVLPTNIVKHLGIKPEYFEYCEFSNPQIPLTIQRMQKRLEQNRRQKQQQQ